MEFKSTDKRDKDTGKRVCPDQVFCRVVLISEVGHKALHIKIQLSHLPHCHMLSFPLSVSLSH